MKVCVTAYSVLCTWVEIMPAAPKLTPKERGAIDVLRKAGNFELQIAKTIEQSKTAFHNYLNGKQTLTIAAKGVRKPMMKKAQL